MTKILIHGDNKSDKYDIIRIYFCTKCGCLFEKNGDIRDHYAGVAFVCCPECNKYECKEICV